MNMDVNGQATVPEEAPGGFPDDPRTPVEEDIRRAEEKKRVSELRVGGAWLWTVILTLGCAGLYAAFFISALTTGQRVISGFAGLLLMLVGMSIYRGQERRKARRASAAAEYAALLEKYGAADIDGIWRRFAEEQAERGK